MSGHDPQLTRASLIKRIRDVRDASAWTTFLETYAPLIYGYCRRKGLQESDAADVTQEVLSEIAKAARGFEYRPERGRFRNWLGALTRHKLAGYFRRHPRLRTGADEQ